MAEIIRQETEMVTNDRAMLGLMEQFTEEDGARLLQMYHNRSESEELALDAVCRHTMAFHFRREKRCQFAKRSLKAAACLMTVILVSGMLALCFSSEARATMISWITRREDAAVTYSPVVQDDDGDLFLQYEVSKLPEDFTLLEELSRAVPGVLFYENPDGKQVTFFFQPPDGRGTLYMIPGEDTIEHVSVNGATADLYIPADPEKSTSIVWTDPETGYLLMVKGVFSKETILELAESVRQIPEQKKP